MAIVDSSSSSSSRIFDSSSSPSGISDCPPTKHTEDQSPNLGEKNPNSDQNSKSEEDGNQKKPNYEDGTSLDRGLDTEIPNGFVTGNRPDSAPNSDFVSETQNDGSGTSSTGSLSSEGGHENENETTENETENGFHNHSHHHHHHHHHAPTMQELVDFFSKLNPHAKEFIPPLSHANSEEISPENANKANNNRKKKNGYGTKKRSANSRLHRAQWDDSIRRTVYVSDIDHQVTEEQLAALFLSCGQVVDCRVCGDPNSVLRFAFVEFTDEDGARRALSLAGTMLGFYPVRVLPSKTAIIPVNPTFLPQSEDEREMCARTIYCTNIDKKISQAEVKLYFESACGKVARLRLLGDHRHSTRIAFVEFVMAESAIGALNCSGVLLGTLPIRVSPSKTPVRSCMARPFFV